MCESLRKMRSEKFWSWGPLARDFFCQLLADANREARWVHLDKLKAKTWIEPGQFIFAKERLADEWGYSVQQIKTLLKKFSTAGIIKIESCLPYNRRSTESITKSKTRYPTKITILNFASYCEVPTESKTTESTEQSTTTLGVVVSPVVISSGVLDVVLPVVSDNVKIRAPARATVPGEPKKTAKQKDTESLDTCHHLPDVIGHWDRIFANLSGGYKFRWTRGRDFDLLKKLIVQYGRAAVMVGAEHWLTKANAWATEVGYSVPAFFDKFNGLVVASGFAKRVARVEVELARGTAATTPTELASQLIAADKARRELLPSDDELSLEPGEMSLTERLKARLTKRTEQPVATLTLDDI